MKGVGFSKHKYVGDPINAIRIFNMKEVDELVLLDISASSANRSISPELVRKVAGECFMPLTVGGGIRSLSDAKILLNAGAEKVVINTAALENPELIREIADVFGSQSVVAGVDVKKTLTGKYRVYSYSGKKKTKWDVMDWVRHIESCGAGEIFLTSIDRDGSMKGYDVSLIKRVSNAVSIPVVASGGAGCLDDLSEAVYEGDASACAAGSYLVLHGKRRAVLISFPKQKELDLLFNRFGASA